MGLSWVGLFGRRGAGGGGVVASVRGTEGKQRRTRKSGNTEGKAIILEMGQHKSPAFKLWATSFAVEIVFRVRVYGVLTVFCVEAPYFTLVGVNMNK